MIDRSTIEKIAELAVEGVAIETKEYGGRTYVNRSLAMLKPPSPAVTTVRTLSGVTTYLQRNPDGLTRSDVVVHVADYATVQVFSGLDPSYRTREVYLEARANLDPFPFGQWLELEPFIIALQSQFVPTEHTALILRLVGNIKDENVKTVADDGVSQQVTTRTGVARVGEEIVPSRVLLAPYRTFAEVEQPPSEFVLRLRRGRDGQLPSAALFESDGGAWRLKAMENVGAWLLNELGDETIIIA